jgi:hypothetical protein
MTLEPTNMNNNSLIRWIHKNSFQRIKNVLDKFSNEEIIACINGLLTWNKNVLLFTEYKKIHLLLDELYARRNKYVPEDKKE